MLSSDFIVIRFRYFFGVYVCCVGGFMWFVLFFVGRFFMVFCVPLFYDLGYLAGYRCYSLSGWLGCIFEFSPS